LSNGNIKRLNESTGVWTLVGNINIYDGNYFVPRYPAINTDGYAVIFASNEVGGLAQPYFRIARIKGTTIQDIDMTPAGGGKGGGNNLIFDDLIYNYIEGHSIDANSYDKTDEVATLGEEGGNASYFFTNKERDTLWALFGSYTGDFLIVSNQIRIRKKNSNNDWSLLVTFDAPGGTNFTHVYPLYAIGTKKLVVMMRGTAIESITGISDIKDAVCLIDFANKKLQVINVLRESSASGDYHIGYEHYIQIFKGKILWNWADWGSTFINMSHFIAEYSGS